MLPAGHTPVTKNANRLQVGLKAPGICSGFSKMIWQMT